LPSSLHRNELREPLSAEMVGIFAPGASPLKRFLFVLALP
jgi:hypothetical protein